MDYTEKLAKWTAKGKAKKVLKLFTSDDKNVVLQAIEAAGKMGGEEAINNLTFMTENQDKELRVAAIKALSNCGLEGTYTRFVNYLINEKDEDVKEVLKEAIATIKARK